MTRIEYRLGADLPAAAVDRFLMGQTPCRRPSNPLRLHNASHF